MEIYEQKKPSIVKWIIFAALLALFVLCTILVTTGKTADVDKPVLDAFVALRNNFLTSVMKILTFCANTYTIIGVCAVLLILPTRFRFGAPASIGVLLCALVNAIIKGIVERVRPDEALRLIDIGSYSFPSGHASAGFMLYILLMILLRRYFFLRNNPGASWFFTIALSLLAFGIGLSRIYLGVHYPTDVLGGWLLAGMMLILFLALYELFYPQQWLLTYEQPAWQMIRRRRPWKRPGRPSKEVPMVEFPSTMIWNEPRISSSQNEDGEPNRLLQQNQQPDPARERRHAQIQRMREQQRPK
ncbi:MAG: phosphatase PAP2 family protein [Clostridiales Family XIII bacterium]|jgi:undecaprenyl-diphosphatase|nr:phosphatase PAP2 family protein [Clostridiales Family XIII bacterium]